MIISRFNASVRFCIAAPESTPRVSRPGLLSRQPAGMRSAPQFPAQLTAQTATGTPFTAALPLS